MGDRAVLDAAINADASGFVKGMREADTSLEKFVLTAEGVGKGIQVAGVKFDQYAASLKRTGQITMGVGIAMGGGLAVASRSAANFQAEMLNVQSIMHASRGEFLSMGDSVLDLSRALPQSAGQLAQGLYDISSSGFQGAEALNILDASAISASAGLTDTAVSAKAITAILNAYGLSSQAAADVSDILFQTVNLGVLSFEELSMTVGEWVGIASAAGVAADEASAAIAAMTLSGINSAEAATALARLLESFINPSEELTAAAQAMGHESSGAMLATLGLAGSMEALRESTGATAEAYTALFPNIRAAKGALALAANDGQNYVSVNDEIADKTARAGAAQAAFAEQAKGLNFQLGILKNNMAAFLVEIGQKMTGALTNIVKLMNLFAKVIDSLPGPVKTLGTGFVAIGAVILTAGGALLAFATHALIWKAVMAAMAATLTKVAGIMGTLHLAKVATGFSTLAESATAAGRRMGPLGAAMEGMKKGVAAIGTRFGAGAASATVFGGALVGTAIAAWTLNNAMNKMKESAAEAEHQFAAGFETRTIDDMEKKLAALNERRNSINRGWNSNPMDFFGVGSALFGGKAPGEMANQEEIEAMEATLRRVSDAAALAFAEVRGFADDPAYQNALEESYEWTGKWADQLEWADERLVKFTGTTGTSAAATSEFSEELLRAAAKTGKVDLTPLGGTDQKAIQGVVDDLGQFQRELDATSGVAAQSESAFAALGAEFQTVGEKLEALDSVIKGFISGQLGLEEATDNVATSVNDMYLSFKEMQEAGTADIAMDFSSKHEDALTLRETMRGLTDDITDQTIAWANEQENLTGSQVRDYLRAQAEDFRLTGEQIGMSSEFVDHYADIIEEIANTPELVTKFNSNVQDQETKVGKYLARLGLADTQIETALSVYEESGQMGLEYYLAQIDLYDGYKATAFLKAEGKDALNTIETVLERFGIAEGGVTAVLDVLINNPEDLDQLLTDLGIVNASDRQVVIDAIGDTDTLTAIEAVKTKAKELDRERPRPEVDLDDMLFNAAIEGIKAKLDELANTHVTIPSPVFGPIEDPNPPGGGFQPGGDQPPHGKTGDRMIINDRSRIGSSRGMRDDNHPFYDPNIADNFGPPGGAASSGGGGSGSGGSSGSGSKKKKGGLDMGPNDFLDLFSNMYELGDLGEDEYIEKLKLLLASTTKYSNEYMSIWNTLEAFDEDKVRETDRLNSVRFDTGDISSAEYLKYLKNRISQTERFSEEWYEIWSEINSVEDRSGKAAAMYSSGAIGTKRYVKFLKNRLSETEKFSTEWYQLWEEINNVENRDGKAAIRYDTGNLSSKQYLKYLKKRLKDTERFSDEWYQIWQEINSVKDNEKDKDKEKFDEEHRVEALRYELGETSAANYLKFLNKRLKGLKKYSEEWAEVWREIQSVEDEAGGSGGRFSDIAGEGFLSTNQVIKYYEKKAREAEQWYNIVEGLKGKVSDAIMNDLLSAGPGSLPLAKVIQQMYESGQLDRLEGYVNSIQQVNQYAEGGGMSPTESTKKVGTLSASESGTQVVITGDLHFTGVDTVEQFIRGVEFEVGARR